MSIFNRIVQWNNERMLIKTPEDVNIKKEISFVLEECIEMVSDLKSEECRDISEDLSENIMQYSSKDITPEQVVDAAADIIVFVTGIIRKMGYNPDIAMDEVLKEIESRVGSVQDGKFVKDKSPEAQANWYKADFSKAKI